MKKIYSTIILISVFIFSSCTGVKTTVTGLENESFLSFYSNDQSVINSKIEVSIGDGNTFVAEVNKMKRNSTNFEKRPKGNIYSIKPGKHDVKVTKNGKLIYSKRIFISNQETKTIIL